MRFAMTGAYPLSCSTRWTVPVSRIPSSRTPGVAAEGSIFISVAMPEKHRTGPRTSGFQR